MDDKEINATALLEDSLELAFARVQEDGLDEQAARKQVLNSLLDQTLD